MMISCFRQIIALFALIGLLSGGGMAVYAQVPEGQSVRGPNDTATTEQLDNSSQEQMSQNTDTAGAATNSADPLEGKSPSERAISDMYRRITLKNPELKLTDFASAISSCVLLLIKTGLPLQSTVIDCPGSSVLISTSVLAKAFTEASGFIWSIKGQTVAPTPTAPSA